MVENQPIDPIENIVPPIEKTDVVQKDFEDLADKIKTNPNAIDKIKNNTLENVDKYLYANKDKSTEMLLNISQAMTDPKLENKDRKSLMELETICLRYTKWENV